MILDEFGKPIRRGNTFCTPEWLKRETGRLVHDWEAERRLMELRNSLEFASAAARAVIGDTIKVRLPKRFERLQSPPQISDTESPR